jgi:hypothetical protein
VQIGLVGGSYQARSLPFNAERSINLFAVLDQRGKVPAALYGTPGLSVFGTVGTGAIRGEFAATNGRNFVVSGAGLFELNADGTSTLRGSLNQSAGIVSIAENGFQLAICDGVTVYIFTYATNAFAQVSSANLPISGTIAFIDGYFVVNEVGTGKFFISSPYDGFTWAALDFATAESSPDNLLRVYNGLGQLWLLGEYTTEIWTNTGASSFPFQRIAGAKVDVGVVAPHSVVEVDKSLFWLGGDKFGTGMVYKTEGLSPTKVSTEAIDLLISKAGNLDQIRAYVYQQEGHVFYVLTGGGLETTLVYDITTGIWHERAYLNQGILEQHLGCCHMFAFGKHLVGDRRNGNIYEMSMDVYADGDDDILRERIYTHLFDDGRRIRYNKLEIAFESGVGLQSGIGSNPQVSLLLSKDGARTWSGTYTAPIGKVGKYMTRVMFRRLGITQQMTFRLKFTARTKVAIVGSFLHE